MDKTKSQKKKRCAKEKILIKKEDIVSFFGIQFKESEVLYVYKNTIVCHRNKHHVIQATARLENHLGKEVLLNVEYCTQCKKLFLDYTLYEEYRRKHKTLIGNIYFAKNGTFETSYELAQESPLHLMGYNVSEKIGLSDKERQYILGSVLYRQIMSKTEVLNYLKTFIKFNGAKKGNESAMTKWSQDLLFVADYNIKLQPQAVIHKITKN